MKSKVPPIPAASLTLGIFLRFLEIHNSWFGAPYATNNMFGLVLLMICVIRFSSGGFGVPAYVPTIFTPGYFFSNIFAVFFAIPSADPSKNTLFCVFAEFLHISDTKSAPVTLSLSTVLKYLGEKGIAMRL